MAGNSGSADSERDPASERDSEGEYESEDATNGNAKERMTMKTKGRKGRPTGSKNKPKHQASEGERQCLEEFVTRRGTLTRTPVKGRTNNAPMVSQDHALTDKGDRGSSQDKLEKMNVKKGKNKEDELDSKLEIINRSITQMIAGLENKIFRGVEEVKQEMKKMKNECISLKRVVHDEIEDLKHEMDKQNQEWDIEKKLLQSRVNQLEEKVEKRRNQGIDEAVAKRWIEEEVEKRLTRGKATIPELQNEERWLKKMEEKVERIAKEKTREGTERALAEMDNKLEKAEREKRRANVIIRGAAFKGENLKAEVEEFFSQEMKLRVQVKKAMGLRREDNSGGAMLVVMGSLEEKQKVMRNRALLKGSRIYVDDDLTKTERGIHKKIWQQAKEEEAKGNWVKRGYMKLVVNGQCWRWNERESRLEVPNFRRQ